MSISWCVFGPIRWTVETDPSLETQQRQESQQQRPLQQHLQRQLQRQLQQQLQHPRRAFLIHAKTYSKN